MRIQKSRAAHIGIREEEGGRDAGKDQFASIVEGLLKDMENDHSHGNHSESILGQHYSSTL